MFTFGGNGVCSEGGMKEVGGGTAPFLKASGGLGMPRFEYSGKPGAR